MHSAQSSPPTLCHFYALDFNIDNGFLADSTTHVAYRMLRGGVSVSEGSVDVPTGALLAFGDPLGFDELLFGAYIDSGEASAALIDSTAILNAAVIDNVRAQITSPSAPVPEPSTPVLSASGALLILARVARRRRQG